MTSHRVERIPKEHRSRVLKALGAIKKARGRHVEGDHVEFIFEVWNEYVSPDNKQSISCPDCRVYVFGQLKYFTQEWQQQQ